ncbi:putative capsid protein [Red panda feces-associated circular DNA virus 11]|uniref:Putative capsid protein n=1 Tax=Red panda feces-associated circular DNA virus 11 TaxID=2863964 RepID=A0A8K1HIQ7_9VIRU|nr:putative capsid protein [Red panda feces-associated circular DNA virus 11]
MPARIHRDTAYTYHVTNNARRHNLGVLGGTVAAGMGAWNNYNKRKAIKNSKGKRNRRTTRPGYRRVTTGGKFRRRGGQASQMQSDAGSSGLKRVFKTRKRWMKGFKKILAPQVLNSIAQTNVTTVVSRQKPQHLLAYYGSTGTTVALCSNSDLTDCQKILGATEPTPATQGSAGNTTANTRKMMLTRLSAKYRLKNQTSVPITVTLYDCVARRDMQAGGLEPVNVWNLGMTEEAVGITGANANANTQLEQFPGATPFQSQLFCQTWKVARKSKFVLHPGSEHNHFITIKPGGLISNDYISRFLYLRGLSTVVMAVVEGGVIQDTTTPFNISTSSAELDCICETRYSFTAMEKSRTAFTQYSLLPSTVTTEGTILEDTDAVSTAARV